MSSKRPLPNPLNSVSVRVFVAVSAIYFSVQIGTGFTSWADFGGFVLALVAIAGIIAIILMPFVRLRSKRLDMIRRTYPGAPAWFVNTMYTSSVLVVTDEEILLLSHTGKVRRRWARDQVRHAVVERLPLAWPRRPGLRLELGNHQTHQTVIIAFPKMLGLWTSEERTREAKQALQRQ